MGKYSLPPSSFTFKMAFGNGTALMLKPERRKVRIHQTIHMKKLSAFLYVCGQTHVRRESIFRNVGPVAF